jgi:hypothetical protein
MTALFLHIGTNKTATSLIQSFCLQHADWLHQQGLIYPNCALSGYGHHYLAAALFNNRVRYHHLQTDHTVDDWCQQLLNTAAAHHVETILLSSEMLWQLQPEDNARLRSFLQYFSSVTIIGYIRRQETWLQSVYCSRIKNNYFQVVPDFADFCTTTDADFSRALAHWEEIADQARLIIRPFVSAAWFRQSILHDFWYQIIGDVALPEITTPLVANASWPLPTLDIMRSLAAIALPNRAACYDFLRTITESFTVPPDEGLLTEQLSHSISQRYAQSNAALAHRYWTAQEQDFFLTQTIATVKNAYRGLTAAQYADVIAELWSRSQA